MSLYRLSLLAAALAIAQGSASAATLSGSAPAVSTTVGGTTTVLLTTTLSDAIDLQGASLYLNWDAGLQFTGVDASVAGGDLNSFIGLFDPQFTVENSGPGAYSLQLVGPLSPITLEAGNATVSFTFKALATGTQNVTIDVHVTDGDFNDVAFTQPLATSVNVSAVPEAPPAAMLAAGLGVLALLARRRRPS
ncbi:hypothetical protein SNE35_18605 [Paucibacter sp. R3-3]|uniref:PEP-CTERM protein-sorting domain-containing protein n=1 Tax=Roseateles agri TaxID=3098619 RepID=A0ABU5DJQ7_9BURK|nr:hypothetical protein [Paucibacter sp. R3-3]MDY0746531.1 hypothetical protein [Paucibacter sp. R3-3]